MKQHHRSIQLFLILTVLVIGIGLRDYWPFSDKDVDSYLEKWNKIQPDGVTEITIKTGEKELAIVKDGFTWKAQDYLIDDSTIQALLSNLITPANPELVAETAASHTKLGVDDGATTMMIGNTDDKRTIFIGTDSGSGRFIRFEGEDATYRIENLPTPITSTDISDWIDKTITNIDEKDIQKIVYKQGRTTITLIQRDGLWFEEGKQIAIDKSSLSALLSSITALRTNGLIDDQEMDLKAPELQLTVQTTNGDTEVLFSPLTNEEMVVTSNKRKGKFTITNSTVDEMKITSSDLKPAPTPTPQQ